MALSQQSVARSMVVFVCGKCNESIKKKNVEQHFNNCRNVTVSCVDCSKDFTYVIRLLFGFRRRQSFVSHTSCITEQEKYDKPNFSQKIPKGANKQMEWTEQVHSRLSDFPAQQGVINLMVKKLMDSSNVPKKKAKFQNFLRSCFKYSRDADIDKIWDFINRPPADSVDSKAVNEGNNEGAPSNVISVPQNGDSAAATGKSSSSKRKDAPSSEVPPKKRQRKNTTERIASQSTDAAEVTCTPDFSTEVLGKKPIKITKLKKRVFKIFRNSTQFNEAVHNDDWLERKFDKILRSKKRFLLSEDGERVSIAPRGEESKDELEQ
ncbi:hypothetical protein SprV_0100220000 [Sparganum proliferum]